MGVPVLIPIVSEKSAGPLLPLPPLLSLLAASASSLAASATSADCLCCLPLLIISATSADPVAHWLGLLARWLPLVPLLAPSAASALES